MTTKAMLMVVDVRLREEGEGEEEEGKEEDEEEGAQAGMRGDGDRSTRHGILILCGCRGRKVFQNLS